MTIDELARQVPPGYGWLVRTDNVGGFAHIFSDDFFAAVVISGGESRDASTGESFLAYGPSPVEALAAALKKMRH